MHQRAHLPKASECPIDADPPHHNVWGGKLAVLSTEPSSALVTKSLKGWMEGYSEIVLIPLTELYVSHALKKYLELITSSGVHQL